MPSLGEEYIRNLVYENVRDKSLVSDVIQDLYFFSLDQMEEREIIFAIKKTLKRYRHYKEAAFSNYYYEGEEGFVNNVILKDKDVLEEPKEATKRDFLSYKDCKTWAEKHLIPKGIDSSKKWYKWQRNKYSKLIGRPRFIPTAPALTYKSKGWVNWATFVNTNNLRTDVEFWTYETARRWVYDNLRGCVTSLTEWDNFRRGELDIDFPNRMPKRPDSVYTEWEDWGMFLWTGNEWLGERINFLSYTDSKRWVAENWPNVNTVREWEQHVVDNGRPKNIPSNPTKAYTRRGEWISWGDFLGTGTIAPQKTKYLSFDESCEWVKHHFKDYNMLMQQDWFDYLDGEYPLNPLPQNIPRSTYRVYNRTDEWRGWKYWFCGRARKRKESIPVYYGIKIKKKLSQKAIANKYNVSQSTITLINGGSLFGKTSCKGSGKLTYQQVNEIKALLI